MNSSAFTHTDVNKVNNNIQIMRYYANNSNVRSRRVIILPTENIVYPYIEGPFGAYDSNENPIEIWNLCIEVDRPSHMRNVVRLDYRTYISAEEVLHKINNCLY
jgi:ribosomal protein S10